MFYWTPVLLGSASYLAYILNHAINVTAVNAIKFFNRIQVGQVMAVDQHEIITFYQGNAINAKTDLLIYGYA